MLDEWTVGAEFNDLDDGHGFELEHEFICLKISVTYI